MTKQEATEVAHQLAEKLRFQTTKDGGIFVSVIAIKCVGMDGDHHVLVVNGRSARNGGKRRKIVDSLKDGMRECFLDAPEERE